MKTCPKCGQAFNDDNLSFCLLDGERLVTGLSEPTVVIPTTDQVSFAPTMPPNKGRKTFLWIALGLLVLAIGGAMLVAVAFISYRIGNERARTNGLSTERVTPTPEGKNSATPASVQTSPTPSPSSSTSDSPGAENDEVIPISWNTSATQFKSDVGLAYSFECPKGGTAMAIWGSDVYTADSSICTAAVHVGKITLDQGGQVTIEMRPGRSIYGSTTRNDITSSTFGEYPHSFVIR